MNKSENINELAKALCIVQSKLTGAIKDSKNPFFKSNYADLESVWDSIRKPLTENGLSVSQMPCVLDNGMPGLETVLMHESGQFISNVVPIVSTKQDPQAYGSAITYFRRYALSAIVGQIQVDDDAEQATNRNQTAEKPQGKDFNFNMNSAPSPGAQAILSSPDFVLKFGKFKGKKLGDVDAYELDSWVTYLKKQPEISDAAHEAIVRAEEFLKSKEFKRK